MQNSKENFNSEVFSLSFQTTNIWTSTFFLKQLLFFSTASKSTNHYSNVIVSLLQEKVQEIL